MIVVDWNNGEREEFRNKSEFESTAGKVGYVLDDASGTVNHFIDGKSSLAGKWRVIGPIESTVQKAARKRSKLRPTIIWESIPESEQAKLLETLGQDLQKMDQMIERIIKLPERAIVALERIADNLDKGIGVHYEARRGRDKQEGVDKENSPDPRIAERVCSPGTHCANPAGVWGHDNATGNAICESICPYFTTCTISHTSLDNAAKGP